MKAAHRLATLWAITLRRLAPNTLRMPARTRCVPQTSSAMAARRFNKCFIASGFHYTPGYAAEGLGAERGGPCTTRLPRRAWTRSAGAANTPQLVQDQAGGAD